MLDLIFDGLRSLGAILCQFIYWLIAILYDLFINVSRVELLTNDYIQPIYQRITMILTIVMVFYITFEMVKFVVQPEQFSDKEKGAPKIVLRMILVVILIAFVPQIFSIAYKVQNKIFDTQVFSKVILGTTNVNAEEFGKNLSFNIFDMFYNVDDESFSTEDLEKKDNCGKMPCKQIVTINKYQLQNEGSLPLLHVGLNDKGKYEEPTTGEKVEKYFIDFNWIFAVIAGGFFAYILLLYCIDVGSRVVQLLFLQIIAPIPIMGYLSPKKDGIFQKWTKQCLTTYLDLFLRTGIIYFVLLICEILSDAFSEGDLVNNVNEDLGWLIYIVLAMGLLMFAHKAPKMLGELFPKMGAASGNFGLSAKDRGVDRAFGTALGVASGATWGAATGIVQGMRRAKSVDGIGNKILNGIGGAAIGATRGTLGGAGRGLWNGAKKGNPLKNGFAGAKNQAISNQRFGNRQENGYGIIDQTGDRVRGVLNLPSRVSELEAQKAPLKRKQDAYTNLSKSNDSIRDYAWKKAQTGKSSYAASYSIAEGRKKALEEKTIDELISLGYLEQGASEDDRAKAITKASGEMKKFKDQATEDYIEQNRNGGDGALTIMLSQRDTDLENYNKHASSSNKIPTRAEFSYTYTDDQGTKITVNVDKEISELTAKEYDEYIKQIAKSKEAELSKDISKITASQEAIKRQTEGSGINEGKK